jgi:dihydrodipicolinate synthase/N-acetylneuraminate lyase
LAAAIDWDATMALRMRLDALGFGVAEAMDTAQRFELGWPGAQRLIRECGALRLAHGFVAGAACDQLAGRPERAELAAAVAFQARFIQECGGLPVILPILPLARADEDEQVAVYGAILDAVDGPVLLHWLGAQFLPELAGYFPGRSLTRILERHAPKVRGLKLSLLEVEREVALRRELLARDQILLTGDDLDFGKLIAGGDGSDWSIAPVKRVSSLAGRELALGDFSHALLGIFVAFAEPAAIALAHLAGGVAARYRQLMEPCEALGRHLFSAPVAHYKAGLAFLAWLNGLQSNPMLPNHREQERDREHYLRCAELASAAGVIENAELAAERLGAT